MRDVAGLSFHREGGVATVTLNRPERLNALTWKMVEGLIDFTEVCSRDDAIRVMVVTGNGRAFSSGDDIVEGMGEVPARHGAPGGLRTDLGLHHEMVQKLLSVPKPVVAAGQAHLAIERVFRYSDRLTLPSEAPCIERRTPHGYACALIVS